MHIFVDESGLFIPTDQNRTSVSCVAALVVPDSQLEDIEEKFCRLADSMGFGGREVKGKLLDERQVSKVIDLLGRHDVVLKIVALDVGLHTNADLDNHKQDQADRMTANVGPRHHEKLVSELREVAQRIRGLPNQPYLQSVALTEVVGAVLRTTILEYAVRRPHELGGFKWVIDPKDHDRTEYEELWRLLVCGFLQSNTLEEPVAFLTEGA